MPSPHQSSFLSLQKVLPKLGMMLHARNPRLRRHCHIFKASLNYIVRPSLKNLKTTTKMMLPEPWWYSAAWGLRLGLSVPSL